MIIVRGHLHADVVYAPLSFKHFWYLLKGILWGKINRCKSVTTHLPLELMHPKKYKNIKWARRLVCFGELLKKMFGIPLYWENAPLLNYGKWNLLHGRMEWELVPNNIELCFDTGHLILGLSSVSEARREIRRVLRDWGRQIKHLHIHENDLLTDQHKKPCLILTEKLLVELKRGRTFIYEK